MQPQTIPFGSRPLTMPKTIPFGSSPLVAQETPKEQPDENNFIQSAFTSLIGRPAIRASQTIGGAIVHAVGNEQQKQNYYNEIAKPVKLPMRLGTVEPQKAFGQGGAKQIVGNAAETATYLAPYGRIEGAVSKAVAPVVSKVGSPLLSKYVPQTVARAGAGAVGGYGFDIKANAEQDKPLFTPGTNTALGAGIGIVAPPIIGAVANKLFPTPALLNTKLDTHIRDIFKGTTADVGKVNEMAFKARRGLELLNKESGNIQIPDIKAPLGSKVNKPFNLQKSSPNELLSGVLEMDKKIASSARTAVGKAKEKGLKIDTTDTEKMIFEAMESGNIQKATGKTMLKQIESIKNDPVKMHDWVQDVNVKYGKKYQRGTIDDTATGKLADDIAEQFRTKLDNVIDRKGYAEAYGNNQELKRMLVAVAKKANKGVNFGDIATDAGLDLGISVLTGNPAYMARTVGSGLFRGILSKMRNTSGFRSFRKAADIASELPTKTKLPSNRVKTQAVASNEVKIAENLVSKKASATQSILDDIEQANHKDLAGGVDTGVNNLQRAIVKAQESGVDFPLEKVSERMQGRYNDYVNNPNAREGTRIPFPQANKTQPPTVAQRNINTTTISEGNITNATPSITRTDQKLNDGVISSILSRENPKVNSPKKGNLLNMIKEKGQDFLDNPKLGLSTQDVSSGSSILGKRIVKEGEQKPTIKLKRNVQVTTLSGEKTMIPEDEVLKAYESGGKALLKDGREYIVSKSQYENIKNNSLKSEAKEFAPELKGTEESITGGVKKQLEWASNKNGDFNSSFNGKEITITPEGSKFYVYEKGGRLGKTVDSLADAKRNAQMYVDQSQAVTKFSSYQLPEGKNYKEILIKAPDTRKAVSIGKIESVFDLQDYYAKKMFGENNFYKLTQFQKQKVFDDVNYSKLHDKLKQNKVINTRVDITDEGIKSQEGVFKSSHWDEPNVISHLRLNERTYKGKKVTFMEELQSDWAREARAGKDTPQNPLLKNWQELSVKRALKEAVDNNSEYLAWTTGEQQAARYDLSKHIDRIEYNSWDNGKTFRTLVYDTKGEQVKSIPADLKPNELAEYVGKEAADKIISGKGVKAEKGFKKLTGVDLKVGGEWAKNLYDKQVKNIVEDVTGHRVETIDLGLPIENKVGKTFSFGGEPIKMSELKVGREIKDQQAGGDWIITKVLDNGKFEASPTNYMLGTLKQTFKDIPSKDIIDFIKNCL